MNQDARTGGAESPRIEHLEWGQMEIAGIGGGRDFKLWPGGGREWDWDETGTRHSPGIQVADVEELIRNGCEAIVLTRGMELALETSPATLALLEAHGIKVYLEETNDGARIYNRLVADGVAVGGLFHSTC